MDKDKKQKIILIAMGALFGLYVVWNFLLSPAMDDIATAETEKEKLEKQQTTAKRYIAMKDKVNAEFQLHDGQCAFVKKNMPLPRGRESRWVSLLLEGMERDLKISNLQIGTGQVYSFEAPETRKKKKKGKGAKAAPKKIELWEDYLVPLELRCGYHQLGQALAYLERVHPFLFVDSLDVKPVKTTQSLEVRLTLSFPRLTEKGEQKLDGFFAVEED